MYKIVWDFKIDHLIPTRKSTLALIKKIKKKKTCYIKDFTFPANYMVKIKKTQKDRQILGPARELKKNKKLLNMKVMVIPIVVGALGMVPKGLEKRLEEFEIRGRTKTIKTTVLLRLT